MFRTVTVPRAVLVTALFCLLAVTAALPAGAKPKIQIQVFEKTQDDCTKVDDDDKNCKIYVRQRGVGVCKQEHKDSAGVYCDTEFKWDLIGHGKLDGDHQVVIVWSPLSSPGTEHCLDRLTYVVTKAGRTATAKTQQDSKCPAKATWLYDVILLYKGQEIARDDPGVLIEN